jgi:hypothetical protein
MPRRSIIVLLVNIPLYRPIVFGPVDLRWTELRLGSKGTMDRDK